MGHCNRDRVNTRNPRVVMGGRGEGGAPANSVSSVQQSVRDLDALWIESLVDMSPYSTCMM